MHAELPRGGGGWFGLLLLNTLVAICIGLFVANVLQPGTLDEARAATGSQTAAAANSRSARAVSRQRAAGACSARSPTTAR